MILNRLRALFKPELYHGWGRHRSYFEGWYFKMVSADERHAFAIIPGIAMDAEGKKQAFIQILDGKNNQADYIKFDFNKFTASPNTFDISIDQNQFSSKRIILSTDEIEGKIELHNTSPWPSHWYSPGIMGPFSFVPFMQCYHGILSMGHSLSGELKYKGKVISFDGGKGYLEKDWGRSFPVGYIWMQSNHFGDPSISIKSSVAHIPWLGSSFTGYIAGVLFEDRIIEFTTYNNTKLLKCNVDAKFVELAYRNNKYSLEIRAEKSNSTTLAAPIQGFMDGRINESMTAKVYVQLTDRKSKKTIIDDIGRNAGLEIAGNISSITT